MKTKQLLKKVSINTNRAVLIGRYITCDGFDLKRSVEVISHAHGDHTEEFEKALGYYDTILTSPATRDLILVDKGRWLRLHRNLIALDYRKKFDYRGEKITLYPVRHVLGASQVLLENREGTRIVYTGDFDEPGTRAVDSDLLVMEATNGTPDDIKRHTREFLTKRLVSLIKKKLSQNRSVFIFSRGCKLQELMNILTRRKVNAPFIAYPKDAKRAEVYRKYGKDVRKILEIGTQEAYGIQKSGQPFVGFFSVKHWRVPEVSRRVEIRVDSCVAKKDFYEPRKNYFVVALSDHASFNGLIEYVRESHPKFVVTDSSRSGARAITLAREIKKRLGIKAKSLPY